MNRWDIRFFGHFQMIVDGVVADEFEADSARALFAYLCMHPGETIRRDYLAALFWPEQSQSSARRNLRTALTRVRRSLGATSGCLESDNHAVALLPPAGFQIDTLAFAAALEAVDQHRHRRLIGCPLCVRHLRRADKLYRGEFLAGFFVDSTPFLDWLSIQREHFHRQAVDALDALTEYWLAQEDWMAARRTAQRALKLEPWREKSHRSLMVALAMTGQRSAALAQFRACEQILRREFDVAPQPETRSLRERIRAGDLPPSSTANPTTGTRQGLATVQWIDELPFVGRSQELSTLIDKVVDPAIRLVSIVGEGGVGKTRLALRAARSVQLSFPDGVCYVWLHPEEYAAPLPDERVSSASTTVAQQIGLACAIPLQDDQPVEQRVRAYLRRRSMLLVLDSFERYEDAIPFLLSLLEAASQCALLVTSHRALNVRQEWVLRLRGLPVPAAPKAEAHRYTSVRLFDVLARRRGVNDVLTDDHLPAVVAICQAVEGLPLGIELAAASLPHIVGLEHPLASTGALAHLLQDTSKLAGRTMLDLPHRHRSLRSLFEAAWSLLNRGEQEALAALSIVRTPFSTDAAAAILGMPSISAVHDLLGQLTDRAFLQSAADGSYRMHDRVRHFAHEKLTARPRQAESIAARHAQFFLTLLADNYRALSGKNSHAVQQMLAAVLEDLRAAWWWASDVQRWDLIAEAAQGFGLFHLLRGLLIEGEQVFARTVDAARQVRAHPSAAYASRAEKSEVRGGREPQPSSVLGANGNTEAATVALARLLLGWAAFLLPRKRLDLVEASLTEALSLTRQLGMSLLEAEAQIDLAWCLYEQGRTSEAETHLRDALTLSERLDDAQLRAEVLRGLGGVHFRRNEWDAARRRLEESLALATQLDDWLLRAAVLQSLSLLTSVLHRNDEAEIFLREALTIYRTQHMEHKEARALFMLGVLADERGHYPEAQRHYRQALQLAESMGHTHSTMETLGNMGISLDQMGNYAEALRYTLAALDVEKEINNPQARCGIVANLSLHYHHLGDQDQALIYARQSIQLAEEIEMPALAAYGYDFQGHALLALDRAGEAAVAYRQALRIRETAQQNILAFESRAGLARAALITDDVHMAQEWIEPIVDHLQRGTLEGAEEPLRVYWTVYQVLNEAQDLRAVQVLERAAALLQDRAAQFSDSDDRQRYLTQVEAHRAILCAHQR